MDLAHQLRDLGASEFSYQGFSVKFRDVAIPQEVPFERVTAPPVPKTLSERAKQFGLGKIPFPGATE